MSKLMTLNEALKVLLDENVEDFIYDIRSRSHEDPTEEDRRWWGDNPDGNAWDHPRVRRWSDACVAIKEYVNAK